MGLGLQCRYIEGYADFKYYLRDDFLCGGQLSSGEHVNQIFCLNSYNFPRYRGSKLGFFFLAEKNAIQRHDSIFDYATCSFC